MNLNITIKGGYIFIIVICRDHMCHIFIKMIEIPKKSRQIYLYHTFILIKIPLTNMNITIKGGHIFIIVNVNYLIILLLRETSYTNSHIQMIQISVILTHYFVK